MGKKAVPFVIVFILLFIPINPASAAGGRTVVSGDASFGERYSSVYLDPEDASEGIDTEDYDAYDFRQLWSQIDHDISDRLHLSIRTQENDRDYDVVPSLNNTTVYGRGRLRFDASDEWTIWAATTVREKDYHGRDLDNLTRIFSLEARVRFGVRNNFRLGWNYEETDYDLEPERDRDAHRFNMRLERPVNDSLVLRFGGSVEIRNFDVNSASREDSTRREVSAGFRYEF